jgi:glucose dehydrogenase
MKFKLVGMLFAVAFLVGCTDTNQSAIPMSSLSATDWPTSNNLGGTQYSPLDQITPENVSQLEVAWEYVVGPEGRGYPTTPIMVGNLMYFPAEGNVNVTAVSADTGELVWTTNIQEIPGLEDETLTRRGVAYWPGTAELEPRIVFSTGGAYLGQLDAATGEPISGPAGVVNLSEGITDKFGESWRVATSPAIYKNLAILAGRTGEQGRYGLPGDPIGIDLLTGERAWRFNIVPQAGEENFGTWGLNGWQDRRAAGVWVPITVDEENDLVFIPTGNATDQNYGGARPGDNLYATSVVALRASTGEYVWHFQHARHDIYDWDTPAPPSLINTVNEAGELVPSVAQMTKPGRIYVLNRLTGEPIWGMEDVPILWSDAPGEQTAATQPHPLKPPGLARDSMDRDEIWTGYTDEHTQYCTELFDRSVQAGPHTPYGMLPSLVFPGSEGGGLWGGVAENPELELMFANTRDLGVIAQLESRTTDFGTPSYGKTKIPTTFYTGPDGYPCNEPPWTRLYAISTRTGDIVWEVPTGEYETLSELGITGASTASNDGGPMATAGGLVFMGATNDAKFRAYDAQTGEVLWSADMDLNVLATPLGYLGADGNQYVAAVAGGGGDRFNFPAQEGQPKIVAFRLAQ